MKILQINVWSGRIKDGLTRFIKDGDYDVICMQEAPWSNNEDGSEFLELFIDTVEKIKKAAGFDYDFRSPNFRVKILNGDAELEHGIVILSKIPIVKSEEKILLDECRVANDASDFRESIKGHGYTAQKVQLENGFTIINYHGYWLKDPMGDEMTVECMKKAAELAKGEEHVVFCGDLNVVAGSPAMRELDFLTDLTAVNNLKTTLRNVRFVKDVACDHILISDDIVCENFEAIDETPSDHKALTATLSLK